VKVEEVKKKKIAKKYKYDYNTQTLQN
jgi:hypothetical protein